MTYNRMEAKKIAGKVCAFCSSSSLPLVKTRCCDKLVCCDTKFISFRGAGFCHFQHEHESVCHFHYNEKHLGAWNECSECRLLFGEEEFENCP